MQIRSPVSPFESPLPGLSRGLPHPAEDGVSVGVGVGNNIRWDGALTPGPIVPREEKGEPAARGQGHGSEPQAWEVPVGCLVHSLLQGGRQQPLNPLLPLSFPGLAGCHSWTCAPSWKQLLSPGGDLTRLARPFLHLSGASAPRVCPLSVNGSERREPAFG